MTYKKSITKSLLLIVGLMMGMSWQLSAREMVGFVGKNHKASKTASDCQNPTAQEELNINNVRTRLLTAGDLWWDLSDAKYEVPKVDPESGELSRNSLFAGALWIGGIDALGQLKVAAQTYRQSGNDFYAGPLNEAGQTEAAVCADFDKFWKVEALDINRFLQDFETGGGSISQAQIPQSILAWPGRNNPYFTQFNSFPLPPDKDMAPFWDVNEDGVYDPFSGDYPVIDSENEGVYADQMIWWVFNDKGNAHTESGGEAIGLEIRALAFGFATNDEVNNMTFYKYVVENNSSATLDSVFFSQWVDPDLGNYLDDFVGCDTLNDLGIVYNGDNDDEGTAPAGYGENPPMLGVDFFKGPYDENGKQLGMSSFLYYNNDFTINGNPETVNHFYGYMAGVWKDGSPFTFGDDGYGGSEPFDFMFPSDPSNNSDGAWSECSVGNTPADRRFLQTSGPFRLEPGVINDVIVGVVWVRDGQWTACSPFRSLLNADRKAQALFDSNFDAIDGPDAPNLTIRELDQELILTLWNENSSNNFNEQYEESDPVLSSIGVEDSTYKFQGYRIYQLKNSTVTSGDFGNTSLAREIATVDIADGVGTIINYTEDPLVGALVPSLEVEGDDSGIRHTFKISKDEFADGDSKLVNYKRYYYSVIAYGYNGYPQYNPESPQADLNAQKIPYLAGRNNVRVYTAIPHRLGAQFAGQSVNSSYGDSPEITQISGQGNGGNSLELTQTSVDQILAQGFIENPVYQPAHGPIDVQVFDPVLVPNRKFRVKILNNNLYELPQKSDQGATLSLNDDGTINYEGPVNADYRSDHFTYYIQDGAGNLESASVVIKFSGNLTDFEGAYNDTYTLHDRPPGPIIIGDPHAGDPFIIDVLANDDFSSTATASIIEFTQPVEGEEYVTLIEDENGKQVFEVNLPNDATILFDDYSWTYLLFDNFTETQTSATVSLSVTDETAQVEFSANDDIFNQSSYSFTLDLLSNDNSPSLSGDDLRVGNNSRWRIEDAETGEVLDVSDGNIELPNEQGIGGYEAVNGATPLGFTVSVVQQKNPKEINGLISATLEFLGDSENEWLTTISDGETTDPRNWIRSGEDFFPNTNTNNVNLSLSDFAEQYTFANDVVTGDRLFDLEENYENILDGGIAPYALVNRTAVVAEEYNDAGVAIRDVLQISPGCSNCSGLENTLDDIYSIDIVFTPDPDKWTRCVVVEMGRVASANQNGAEKNSIRKQQSVDKNGNFMTDDEGRSWFPGYAINVETGERLNIMFGENSFIGNEFGYSRDMIWNPTSEERGETGVFTFGNYLMGLEHWVYVMDSRYDEGEKYQTLLQSGSTADKRAVYEEAMWVSTTRLAEGAELLSMEDGLVPSEAKMSVRVTRPYVPEASEEPLCYEFDMGDYAIAYDEEKAQLSTLDAVRVVPNPYYAFSSYENNKLDNTVKITNLPPRATARIFNMSGALVRQLEIDKRGVDTSSSSKNNSSANRNEINWKLKNYKGIPIASGMYLIHIEDPDSGDEKVIKWFGVVRPVDLDTF